MLKQTLLRKSPKPTSHVAPVLRKTTSDLRVFRVAVQVQTPLELMRDWCEVHSVILVKGDWPWEGFLSSSADALIQRSAAFDPPTPLSSVCSPGEAMGPENQAQGGLDVGVDFRN